MTKYEMWNNFKPGSSKKKLNLIHPEQQKDDSEGGVDNLGLGGKDDNGMEEDDERLLLDQTDDDELNQT